MKEILKTIYQRSLPILSYVFPFIEVSYYFGAKVFLNTDNIALKYFYVRNIEGLAQFYGENVYFIFAVMVAIFLICSRGTLPLTKFVRFNIIQAILLNIICSCIGAIYNLCPLVVKEGLIGILLANFCYLGVIALMIYSCVLIIFGRYPRIPILSEAARLQVQRGYLDE